jgi:hypothetical protein
MKLRASSLKLLHLHASYAHLWKLPRAGKAFGCKEEIKEADIGNCLFVLTGWRYLLFSLFALNQKPLSAASTAFTFTFYPPWAGWKQTRSGSCA